LRLTKNKIKEQIKSRGLKLTPQRCAIYEILAARSDHPTAEEIYRTVKRAYPMISQNTVYYTISALKDAGLVSEVNLGHQHARFDANLERHHHLVCLGCQKIEDIYEAGLNRLKLAPRNRRGFAIQGHRVEFQGYCGSCQRNKRP
jgi:Fur family transcriptional regulator, peroxide stress response regulator